MKIYVPPLPPRAKAIVDQILDWVNVPIWTPLVPHYRRIEVRRIDIILIVFGIIGASYYWYYGGWRGALYGTLVYLMGVMTALWIL